MIRGESIQELVRESIAVKERILNDRELLERIAEVAELCVDCLRAKRKILLAGNGGSAGDAQHIAAEFVGRFKRERKGLPAIALTTDTSLITAVANDYGYDQVFRRQIEALGQSGDVFIGISTSGNSPNVVKAAVAAAAQGLVTVSLSGASGGQLSRECRHSIVVPSTETPRIQEAHIMIAHIICESVDEVLLEPISKSSL
jgi:D-sedoheptulose 7-phosphate isomerase